ncbi:hypothetical protein HD554DRAFT_2171616 [Boletus coccyginus]|nr:hypothetical protein HD554DRAFT_2171616 [Boletus coccyginus]
MYPIPGLARPPLAPFPNTTLPAPPSFSASLYSADGPSFVPNCQGQGAIFPQTNALFPLDLYGAGCPSFVPNYQGQSTIFPPTNASFFPDTHDGGSPSFVPNYQGQGIISPPANLPPPMFPTNNAYLQQSPFSGICSDATTDFLPSSNDSPCKQARPVRLSVAASQPVRGCCHPGANSGPSRSRSLYNGSFQGSGSLHGGNYQGSVAFQATPPASEVHPGHHQRKNHTRFQSPEEAKISKKPKIRTCKNMQGQKLYYCELCEKWVLVHRKKFHDKKHSPETGEFVCKICEIIGMRCETLSRKDALKRHVDMKHPEYKVLLGDLDLNILVPRKRDEYEDLRELKRAIKLLKAQRALPAAN